MVVNSVNLSHSASNNLLPILLKSSTVHLSMRSIPPCIPRQWGPLSVEEMSVSILQYLPVSLADTIVWAFYRILRTGSIRYRGNLPEGKYNPDWYPFASRRVPPIDKGGFAVAVAEGGIIVHSCISGISGKKIKFQNKRDVVNTILSDESEELDFDVVVLCTGYKADWSWLQIPTTVSANPPHSSSTSTTSTTHFPTSTSTLKISAHGHGIHHGRTHTRTLDHDSACAYLAKSSSMSPESSREGMFFVGYDPGPALIPLMGIRSQAQSVAECMKCALRD